MAAPNSANNNYAKRPNNVVVANSYKENFPERIRKVDRSDVSKTGVKENVRNVRTSSMPGNPKNRVDNTRDTTDEIFNKTYASAGIQPAELGTKPKPENIETGPDATRNAQVEYSDQGVANNNQTTTKQEEEMSEARKLKKKLAQVKVFTLNMNIWVVGLFSWLFVQLPLALLATVFFGMQGGIDWLIEKATVINDGDGWLIGGLKTVGKAVKSVAEAGVWVFEKLTGYDPSYVNPGSAAVIINSLIFLYGVFVLLVIFMVYKISLINPLFGRKSSGFKVGMFLLAMVGYFMPIANLLPWFIPWTFVVLAKPK